MPFRHTAMTRRQIRTEGLDQVCPTSDWVLVGSMLHDLQYRTLHLKSLLCDRSK
ncbi:hypothetical protein CPB84DRAFT_1796525 [Gymnopilus junonius]|uniref:Uncharacterized protein n=1 Tax=Gymnopilus junonius TaxID=109634 RepID=A0A9P5TH32_GYMJU|nr:hypothetical protein CPB84DRAFT_1796525 [Gymnopilus junonius]